MLYPSVAEVVKADREQVCRWWYALRPPQNALEERVLYLIGKKFTCLGGPSDEIAKKLSKPRPPDRVQLPSRPRK